MEKILYINHTSIIGGAEKSLLDLVKHLDRSKYTPYVLLFEEGPFLKSLKDIGISSTIIKVSKKVIGVRRYEIKFIPYFLLHQMTLVLPCIFQIISFIKKNNVDVIHTNTLKAHFLGGIAGKLTGKPVIWHFRDYISPSTTKTLIKYFSYFIPNFIICNSNFVSSQFPEKIREKTKTIYNGFDFKDIDFLKNPINVRESLDINEKGTLVVGMFGRIETWKGHKVLIEAAIEILKELPKTLFLITGESQDSEKLYEGELKNRIRECRMEKNFIFTGFRSDILNLINCVDVVVNPSIEPEPFGRVIMESMALGKAVIAANCGGPTEIITHNLNGLLIQNLNSKELAKEIIELLRSDEKRTIIGQAAKNHIAQNFGMEKYISGIEEIYSSI